MNMRNVQGIFFVEFTGAVFNRHLKNYKTTKITVFLRGGGCGGGRGDGRGIPKLN